MPLSLIEEDILEINEEFNSATLQETNDIPIEEEQLSSRVVCSRIMMKAILQSVSTS